MAGNIIVTTTRNDVVFNVDKKSYGDATKQIRKLKKEWEGIGKTATGRGRASGTGSRAGAGPAEQLMSATKQMQLVNKRLAETRKKEETKITAHRIAMAKKEARAKEAIQKQSAARIRQTVGNLTSQNPDTAKMRKYYQEMERKAKKDPNANWVSPHKAGGQQRLRDLLAAQAAARSGATGDAGRGADFARALANEKRTAAIEATKIGPPRPAAPMPAGAGPGRRPYQQGAPFQGPVKPAGYDAAARARARQQASAEDRIAISSIRLSGKYGAGYQNKLGSGSGGGLGKLNADLRAGSIGVKEYNAHLANLERQFRQNQKAALSFGDALKDVRGSLVGIGAAYGLFSAGKSVLEHGQFFQGLDAQMTMISSSPQEGKQREKFVKDQAYRLGLDLPIASQGYTQMAISGQGQISGDQTNELFKGYSEYATALQVDPVKYQRGITAIGQMLGKGQIMAEELKSQLAEGIPGSLQVFVKAAQEAFGDTTIDVEKLMKMMQNGELKAAKVLPFVAKYYAEAARQGGALEKALNGNRVAMQRMGQTWINFQNAIFQGGFGEQMTKIFNDIAKVLDANAPLAQNLGRFFGKMIEGAWDMVSEIHDAFTLLSSILNHYMDEWGVKGETLGKIFDWVAYTAGIFIFTSAVAKLFGWLSKIAGLAGALASVAGAVGAASGGMGPNDGPPRRGGGRTGGWGRGLGVAGYTSIVGGSMGLGDYVFDKAADKSDDWYGTDTTAGGNLKKDSWLGQAYDWFSAQNAEKENSRADYLRRNGLDPVSMQNQNPFPAPLTAQQPQEGTVTVKIDAGELSKYMKVLIDEQNGFNFNLLTMGGH